MSLRPPAKKKRDSFNQKLLITSPFWQGKLDLLSNATAIRMAEALEPSGPIGIGNGEDPFWKGFKHTYGKKDSNIDFLLRVKSQHPEKIVLVQIGEFYESWGIDSVFLVEHCGLNRMGRGGPRAGMPLGNIQPVLDRLTQAGFSVVICEQATHTLKNGRKTRFIAEIVTPSSSVYTYGLAMDKRRGNTTFPDCPPEFGLAFDKRGVILVEINPDLRTVLVQEGLTKEAAQVRLSRYGGRINRVICHESVDQEFLEACHLHYENIIQVSGYLPKDFPRRAEELIKIDLSLDQQTPFTHIHPSEECEDNAPRALYLGTAQQMGLLPYSGIPSLIESMLPKGSPVTCQNLLRNFLLNPPSQAIASATRKTLESIKGESISFPDFPVSNPARYVKTIHRREASPDILKDLFEIAHSFSACYKTPFKDQMPNALSVVTHILNMGMREGDLQKSSRFITKLLGPVIPKEDDTPHHPKHENISAYLFEQIEDCFRGRVAKTSLPEIETLYEKVKKTAAKYERVLVEELFVLVEARLKPKDKEKKQKPLSLALDLHNLAIWLKGPVEADEVNQYKLICPLDRYGKEVKDRLTTANVEKALNTYKQAVEQTRQAVFKLLQDLSDQLMEHSLPIVHLATFSNLMRTLCLHVRGCTTKQWGLSVQSQSDLENRLELDSFFPYWMNPNQAVRNSLCLDGMAILTGHNMAGKSTTLRSSAVVTLLASAGLMFPARQVGFREGIDGWFLRTGSQDDPESGLSSFAVEMMEVKTALREASKNSFILIDELGKGTESMAGHALAGSVLESLHDQAVCGIFSTHWHELFFNPEIQLSSIQEVKMEIKEGRPSYKVVAGRCVSSFAFEAALQIGVDPKIVERARELADNYPLQAHKIGSALHSLPPAEEYTLESAGKILAQVTGCAYEDIRVIQSQSNPFLKDLNTSVLYLIRTKQGFFYVGETDDIHSRFETHCQEEAKREGQWLYTTIAKGKSAARKFETQLILRLKELGYPMLSTEDAKHSHFGV